ncbi:MAG: hypothetical protein K0M39_09170 [Rhizobium sp.]|nr:hypothetical protein [Rhizobium sp.]
MATKTNKWGDLPIQDFTQFIALVSDMTLDKVFYPVSEENPDMGLMGNLLGHSSHPLHPNFNPPMQQAGGGLLEGGPLRFEPQFIDYEGERVKQAGRVAEHWQAIKSNMLFKWLSADANFKKAKAVFEQKRATAKDSALYAHAYAEFRFLEAVASNACIFLLTDGKAFDWPTPNKKDVVKAQGHIWEVLDAFDKGGVKLRDYGKQSRLHALLTELSDQLDVQVNDRAEPGGKNRRYRVYIGLLAKALRRHFGEVSPEIVMSLAGMVGCPYSNRTITEQLKGSRQEHSQALAKALLTQGNNSSKFG